MQNYPVSIFLPIYNFDPARLGTNVRTVGAFANEHYPEFEIILVDDTSGSETRRAIHEAALAPSVRVRAYTNGPSRRENLAASFREAKFDILCFMDIDLSTELSYLPPLTDAIHDGYEVAIGSRRKGIRPKRERHRLFMSRLYNTTLAVLFRSPIADHTCGFKAFRKQSIVRLVDEMGYDASGTRGWFWDAEMLIRARRHGHRIRELPVAWRADKETTFSLKRELRIIPPLVSFWFSSLTR